VHVVSGGGDETAATGRGSAAALAQRAKECNHMLGEMEGLNLLMRKRQANGKNASGRYKCSDQA